MGVAILEGDDLTFFGVKNLKAGGKRSPGDVLSRARRYVAKLLERYEPDVLAIEGTFVIRNRNSALLNVLADEIKSLCEKRGLKVVEFAPAKVKKAVCGTGNATKRDVSRRLAGTYPELRRFLRPGEGLNHCKEKYWQNMFDALALCLAYLHETA